MGDLLRKRGIILTGMELIAFISTFLGISLGITGLISWFSNRAKQYSEKGFQSAQIEIVKLQLESLLEQAKIMGDKLDTTLERLTRLEESVKTAHKRIDSLGGK